MRSEMETETEPDVSDEPDESDDSENQGWLTRRNLLYGAGGLGALAAGGVGVAAWRAEPADDHPWFHSDDPDVLVMAHAGGKALRPDNTLLAFERAAEMGADVLETDVQVTADGVPVCVHDATVDSRTEATGRVDEMTLSELKELDGAYSWSPPGGGGDGDDAGNVEGDDHPYRDEGVEIPTLAEAFAAHPDARWNVELKPAVEDAEPFCRVVEEHGMEEQVLAASFTPLIEQVRRQCPAVATSSHRNEILWFLVSNRVGLTATYDAPSYAFQVPREQDGVRVLTEGFVEGAHSRGVDVHAWTINERSEMRRLADMGVDGIITDRPDRALSVLGRS